ncbi:dihydrolipoamide acetyltransferase family protein [Nesterenkonia xinjiangensis]|uniref:Dihydrolipoamide acetyltransferase component of pyruvate dehydrogenase complex n=1 Tax=Nesterenkonia xinjiangensis TaxID=225327 RepID=A0A7Z0GNX9_9MICC|nr:dihydrolipoamide acetyltransferase family protein [Nesterenkonia xinjiangensis]NYJ78571.1 pyruvate dehydrogenase E2 component (dihydrolipoamide acetyltransferase) [Nesterenkonia xinjiangensis]
MVDTFNLPDVGEGLTEAEIVSWRVAVGDTVEVNDIVVEIETAKSLVELPIPYAGQVEELVAEEGETIEVGSPLIRITAAGSGAESSDGGAESPGTEQGGSGSGDAKGPDPAQEVTSDTAPTAPQRTPQKDARKDQKKAGGEDALVGSGPKADSARRRPRTRSTAPDLVDVTDLGLTDTVPAPASSTGAPDIGDLVAKASPPVRALAKRLGVAVWELVGSGGNGKITRDDVERRARQKNGEKAPPPSTPAEPPFTGLLREGPRDEDVQVRGVRKATAANVSASASQIPHVSVFKEIDVTRTMELRTVLKKDPSYEGLSVSPLLFAAKAIIWAARRNPQVNATWHDTYFTVRNYVNLGIAAATPRGLMVPVIHDAQTYSTKGLAAAITQLTVDARDGKTAPADMQGGTVSITNIGPLGLDGGTPILPPGQAAIVALGAVRRKPWVVDEQIVPRDVMTIGGSFDHRLIDGEHAGRFISDVGAVLEQPGLLLE